jgi:O2-independent ubiquinone biosynthesis accessory factor UbiT
VSGHATTQSYGSDAPMRTGRGGLPGAAFAAMRLLPLAPLDIAANAMLAALLARRPRMLGRLGEHAGKRFAIDPTDCPFVFLLEPCAQNPRLHAAPSLAGVDYDVRIAGVLMVLIGLLDGAYDGDALFFSRDLVIEGDTAAVLALRNAIEDAALTPDLVLGVPERLGPMVNGGLRRAGRRLRHLLGAPGERHPCQPSERP